jgi:hypothetical protein
MLGREDMKNEGPEGRSVPPFGNADIMRAGIKYPKETTTPISKLLVLVKRNERKSESEVRVRVEQEK